MWRLVWCPISIRWKRSARVPGEQVGAVDSYATPTDLIVTTGPTEPVLASPALHTVSKVWLAEMDQPNGVSASVEAAISSR